MNKLDFFKLVTEKVVISEKELNELYNSKRVDLKNKGFPDNQLDDYTLRVLMTLFKKQFASKATKYEGFIIGDMGVTDYGAQREYDKIKKQWNEANDVLKQCMIKDGFITPDGIPLWKTTNFKNGMPIDSEKNKERTILMIARKEGESVYKKTHLKLKGDKLKLTLPKFNKDIVKVQFRANIKSDDEIMVLNSASVTEFIETSEKMNAVQLLKTYFASNLVENLNGLALSHEHNANDFNRLVVVKGNIASINVETSLSNMMLISDDSLSYDEGINCYISKDFPIDFGECSMDCIFIGRTNTRINPETNETSLTLTLYGIFVDDMWKFQKKEIKESDIKESNNW